MTCLMKKRVSRACLMQRENIQDLSNVLSRAYVHVLLPPWASPRGHFGRKYTRRNIFFFPDIVFLKIQPLEHYLFWRKKRLAFAHCTARSARASDAILPLFILSTVHLSISHTFSPMSTQSGFSHFSKFTFISKQCLRAIHGGTLVSDRLMMVRGAFKATTFRDIREDHQTGEILLSLM